jgi:hypothetical protein
VITKTLVLHTKVESNAARQQWRQWFFDAVAQGAAWAHAYSREKERWLPRVVSEGEVRTASPCAQLKADTDAAIAQGVFGVPSYAVDGKVFWGLDALPMLRDYLDGGAWFAGSAWADAPVIESGLPRRPA